MEAEVRPESICPLRPYLIYLPLPIRAPGAKSYDGSCLAISVFPNTLYDIAITKCMGRVPTYVYPTAQGGYPKIAPGSSLDTCAKIFAYLQKQDTFPENGIAQ